MIALGNTGTDLINSIKQAREFGIGEGKQQLVSFVLTVPDIAALGLAAAQNVLGERGFLLGPGRSDARLVPPVRRAQWRTHAVHDPGG